MAGQAPGDGADARADGTDSIDISATAHAVRLPGLVIAGLASLGAGTVHAAAAGIHAEHVTLTRLFVGLAAAQLAAGLVALIRPSRLAASIVIIVNAAAVGGWLITRLSGVSWIAGLEVREAAQFADSVCALLGGIAAGAAAGALLVGWRPAPSPRLGLSAFAVAALAVPAMFTGTSHSHSGGDHAHSDTETAAGADGHAAHDDESNSDHAHADPTSGSPDTTEHGHDDAATATWPRPWDPAGPIDISGVEGVSPEQERRATLLIEQSLVELPKYADTAAAVADGYVSIGDAGTGSEHYIKGSLINDSILLDPSQPESLVYTVDGDDRILAGAMYIASARPTDDPSLLEFAGPLMQWHNHGNLCWSAENGTAKVVGVTRADGTCERGVNAGGENPMVHVWITPHPCGVFAALEGIGAGQAAVPEDQRVDMCADDHGHGAEHNEPAAEPKPYDPTKPIDLGGTPGVTPEQQAAAENLVAVTLVQLPQWADYRDAEAAGFHSIGDAGTGFEHFIQWDWIDDDVHLNPNFPESLVYAPQPDGSKQLLSAMYMLPRTVALSDVPDIGGALMQWHIHDNLCFTKSDAPRVAGFVDSQGECPPRLQKFPPAPMIHVWITPHRCGPFAALEGLAAGQIENGEERLCDHAHGSGGF